MSDERRAERDARAYFEETAPSHGPDDLLADVFLETSATRPRPRWLAVLTEPQLRTGRVARGRVAPRLGWPRSC